MSFFRRLIANRAGPFRSCPCNHFAAGGKIKGSYFAFGLSDGRAHHRDAGQCFGPLNRSNARCGRRLRSCQTTPLMTNIEA
jgi:hypothetical protein